MTDVFAEWIAGQYEGGVFGTGRKRHYEVLQRELCRFLVMRRMKDITVKEFDGLCCMTSHYGFGTNGVLLRNTLNFTRVLTKGAYPGKSEAATP